MKNNNAIKGKGVNVEILLERYRTLKNISQMEIAEAIGVDQDYISSIESGRADVPVDVLGRIAAYLGVNYSDLVKVTILPVDTELRQAAMLMGYQDL